MRTIERIAHVAVNLSAATFWSVTVTMLVLLLTGRLPLERWASAGKVLRGEAEAVKPATLRTLEEAKERDDARSRDPAFRLLVQQVSEIEELRRRTLSEAANEKARLTEWQRTLEAMKSSMEQDVARWEQERARLEKAVAAAGERARTEADTRLFNIYNQMDASQIAQELTVRHRAGEAQEAARILAGLPERKTAEVLQEVADPM
ncbi:MAG TPA: hypothetical protein ENN09_04835, partial [Planctomycetes bacterium]|nr:hypothetical protein [Planctomycetota bacterium]